MLFQEWNADDKCSWCWQLNTQVWIWSHQLITQVDFVSNCLLSWCLCSCIAWQQCLGLWVGCWGLIACHGLVAVQRAKIWWSLTLAADAGVIRMPEHPVLCRLIKLQFGVWFCDKFFSACCTNVQFLLCLALALSFSLRYPLAMPCN